MSQGSCHFYKRDENEIINEIGKEKSLQALDDMLLIRNFEQRGEQAYQTGKVWGFYHSYIGQEAIQTAATYALGAKENLWVTTYRCHALALLLGMTAKEGMCELYGKANGNAKGRGGSMHLYTDNMFGGFGIVGGQWPIGAGLAFSLKYREEKDKVAVCFGGDGSVVQGVFHESANLAKLWKLPVIFVVENNHLGMGTQVHRAIAALPIGEHLAKAYDMKHFTVDGMHFPLCYGVFKEAKEYVIKNQEPVLIEAVTHRFKGHSISDAALYRSKEELHKIMQRDPIGLFAKLLIEKNILTEAELEERNKRKKEEVIEAMEFADKSPFPDPILLEEGVIC